MSITQTYNYGHTSNDTAEIRAQDIYIPKLLRFQWLSFCAMCLIIALPPLLNITAPPVIPLIAVALTMLAFNIIFSSYCRYGNRIAKTPIVHTLILDIIAWSTLLYYSGGTHNPLVSILLPFVIVGAATLPKHQAWGLGLMSLLIYVLLWEFHWQQSISDTQIVTIMHMLGLGFTFFFSVLASVWFISHITETAQKYLIGLSAADEAALRDDWVVYMGGLAAGTAHELSTPISTLGTLVESMHKQEDPVYVCRTDLELMVAQLSSCQQSLNLLKNKACYFSQSEQNKSFDAYDWFCELGNVYKALYPSATIKIELNPNLAGLRLNFDISLKQAIRNILDNAVAAHHKGVILAACLIGEFLQIRIADHGPGIGDETLQRLKQRLPQQSEHGLGIGLALSNNTIERYRGSLDFSTIPQGGTEVEIKLPLNEICAS